MLRIISHFVVAFSFSFSQEKVEQKCKKLPERFCALMLRLVEIDQESPDPAQRLLQQRFLDEQRSFSLVDVLRPPFAGSSEAVYIARSTSKRGFLQVVNLQRGSFSCFLTHVAETPAESSIRCMAFAPCVFSPSLVTSGDDRSEDALTSMCPCMVVYALAYSNQVLVGDPNTGQVIVLDEYQCRPSCVVADGSVIVAGDGRGRVHAYRGALVTETQDGFASEKSLMWSTPLTVHSVATVGFVQDRFVVAGSNDFTISVLDAGTGTVVSSLIGESTPLVAIRVPVGFERPATPTVELCFSSGVTCRFSSHDGTSWSLTNAARLPASPSCVAAVRSAAPPRDEIAITGTDDGNVILCVMSGRKWEATNSIEVNSRVAGVFVVAPNDACASVIVCTEAGDIWQWTMAELDATEEKEADADGIDASTCVPHALDPASVHSTEAKEVSIEELVQRVQHSDAPRPAEEADDNSVVIIMDDTNDAAVSVAGTDASAVPSSVALTNATNNTTRDELLRFRHRPTGNVKFAEVVDSNKTAHTPLPQLGGGSATHSEDPRGTKNSVVLPSADAEAQRKSAEVVPFTEIHGLRSGRRVDPRHIQNVLQRVDDSYRWEDSAPPSESPLRCVDSQSTLAVVEERNRVDSAHFDLQAAVLQNPLQAEALKFQFPVKATRYTSDEVVFAGVGTTQPLHFHHDENLDSTGTLQRQRAAVDDLVDATFEKFASRRDVQAQRAAAHKAAGPEISRHLCYSLLCPPAHATPAAIWFPELAVPMAVSSALVMPMPLPPSSVALL